jgi:hypothetical protein
VPNSLNALEQQRAQILVRLAQLGDLRTGSITQTSGRCGKTSCRCHQPNQPPHGPNPRLTFKLKGKSVTESLPSPAFIRKAELEIAEFRKFQQLTREFLDVNAQICRLRPVEEPAQTSHEKKLPKPSNTKRRAK